MSHLLDLFTKPRQTSDVVFVSWERHRRTRELAAAIPAALVEVSSTWHRPAKYFPLIWMTLGHLTRLRPSVLIVQCPSVVLAILAVAMRPLYRYRLVLDLHNEAVQPFNYPGEAASRLLRWLWGRADVCVVTNEELARVIQRSARRTCVVHDKVPTFHPPPKATLPRTGATAVFICTYAPDEPYREVVEAARSLPPNIQVHVTGDPTNATLPADLPVNVRICGFLPTPEFEALLYDADLLIDLTAMEHCLVCGAYEAVGLGKPLVTSDTPALRTYFSKGTIYSGHSSQALASAIRRALDGRDVLALEMGELRLALDAQWETERQALLASLKSSRTPEHGLSARASP